LLQKKRGWFQPPSLPLTLYFVCIFSRLGPGPDKARKKDSLGSAPYRRDELQHQIDELEAKIERLAAKLYGEGGEKVA
jgi:hypothetical protein